jgi:hypothetical protein
MKDKFHLNDEGLAEDVLLSLRKLFVLINHQIKYYDDEMEQHEKNAQLYLTGKRDKTYNELLSRQEEWEWLHEHLIDKWDTLQVNT